MQTSYLAPERQVLFFSGHPNGETNQRLVFITQNRANAQAYEVMTKIGLEQHRQLITGCGCTTEKPWVDGPGVIEFESELAAIEAAQTKFHTEPKKW